MMLQLYFEVVFLAQTSYALIKISRSFLFAFLFPFNALGTVLFLRKEMLFICRVLRAMFESGAAHFCECYDKDLLQKDRLYFSQNYT